MEMEEKETKQNKIQQNTKHKTKQNKTKTKQKIKKKSFILKAPTKKIPDHVLPREIFVLPFHQEGEKQSSFITMFFFSF